jgi:hypothetical protein
LLSEFGMTFAELEEKYGGVIRAEITEGGGYVDVLYFFEASAGGYGFAAEEDDISEITLPDGSPRVKGDVQAASPTAITAAVNRDKTRFFIDTLPTFHKSFTYYNIFSKRIPLV